MCVCEFLLTVLKVILYDELSGLSVKKVVVMFADNSI